MSDELKIIPISTVKFSYQLIKRPTWSQFINMQIGVLADTPNNIMRSLREKVAVFITRGVNSLLQRNDA